MNNFYSDNSKCNNNYHIYFNDKIVGKNEDVIDNAQFFSSKSDVNMVFKNIYYKLNDIVKSNIDINITVLPDFFIDRIIQISDMDNLIDVIGKKLR